EKIDKLVVPTTGFANESFFAMQPTHFHDTNKIGGLGVANLAIKNNGKWQEILKNKYFGSKSLTQINVLVNDWHNLLNLMATIQRKKHGAQESKLEQDLQMTETYWNNMTSSN
ncbi:hypothetical protein ACJX0J_023368, partial [Zea mays]